MELLTQVTPLAEEDKTLSLHVFDSVAVSDRVHCFSFGTAFSTEDIFDIVELGAVVRSIRARLVAEGKMPSSIVAKRYDSEF